MREKKYQTPDNEIITGITPEHAIRKLRERRNHSDKYYDFAYNWTLHADEIHLISSKG